MANQPQFTSGEDIHRESSLLPCQVFPGSSYARSCISVPFSSVWQRIFSPCHHSRHRSMQDLRLSTFLVNGTQDPQPLPAPFILLSQTLLHQVNVLPSGAIVMYIFREFAWTLAQCCLSTPSPSLELQQGNHLNLSHHSTHHTSYKWFGTNCNLSGK